MFSSPNLSRWTALLARRLLYAWIRTRIYPDKLADLGLDPDRPVCYVLQDHRLTNVLVLIEETRRAGLPRANELLTMGPVAAVHSFFSLNRIQSLGASARDRHSHPPLMVQLVQAASADPALNAQLVPVTILWGRSPGSQESILKALFSETWGPTGHLRQLLAVLFHGRDAYVRFNAPLSLRELLAGCTDEARALRKLSRVLRVHFRLQRQRVIGPDLSHRNTQLATLLARPAVRQAIAREAAERRISLDEAHDRARRFALEIPSDYSYGVVRAFELFLDWLWTRLYDGIEVHHFDAVENIPPGAGIVYLPCHRSHIDYLLLSFVVYRRGMTPPHIAAGINLNMPVIGPLLRRAGAFFLRRSFKDEPLYAAVFDEYLHLMLSRGFPIEYFIEGTRSRSGRMLAPRTGILGMTIKSFLRDHTHPLVFVPVYVGYEKLIEGRSFVSELAGRPKRGESLWGLIGTVRKLRHEFGKVHVNFGRPLNLSEFLDQAHPGWFDLPESDLRADWVRQSTRAVAGELTCRINEAAVVNPINLVALALLATPKHSIDEQDLYRLIGHYQALSQDSPYSPEMVGCQANPQQILDQAMRLGVVERLVHPLGDLIRVPAEQAALLGYFRNNVLHLFAVPAVIACLLSQNPGLDRRRFEAAVKGIHGLLGAELFLRWQVSQLSEPLEAALAVLSRRGLLRLSGEQLWAPEANSAEYAELRLIGETVRPTLERHFLTLALLQRHGSGRLTRRGLEESGHLLAQRLALLYEFNAPEFSERALFSGVVGNLLANGLLSEDADGLLHFDDRISVPAQHTELLLSAEVRQAVLRIASERVARAEDGGRLSPG